MAEAPAGGTVVPKSGRRSKKDTSETEGPDASYAAALKACRATPDDGDVWAHAEAQADALQRPDELGALYREVLEKPLARPLRAALAQRAVQFHETWFGGDPEAMAAVLGRIVEHDHDANWAFERLTVVLTSAERWDALLDVYDRALAHTSEPKRRKLLLDDAAHVAKDFAVDPRRAVDYMLLQLDLDPGNPKLVAAIERLLERQRRYEDLIELWQARLPDLATAEARATRVRIATTFIDHLDAPGQALEELRALVDESPGHADGCKQLERVLDLATAPHGVRMAALALLRVSYDAVDKADAAVAAVERAIPVTDGAELLALHREAGARHAIAGRDGEAMAHYAELLRREPSDTDARRQLRQIARRSNQYALFAAALVTATAGAEPSQRVALLYEAAQAQAQELGDAGEAASLFGQVVAEADADRALALSAAHQLGELLAASGRDADRLAVLEQVADLERSSSVRRAVLGEAGRLADRLGDPDRALSAYARRLGEDHDDHEALAATIDVLEHNKRWAPLVEALERRANATKLPAQRRADLGRVAKIQAERLEALDDAIETWSIVRTEYGDEPETIDALDRLLAARMRPNDRVQIVGGAAESIRARVCELLVRLGDIRRTELADVAGATRAYADALAIEPKDEGARRGLRALLDGGTPVAAAATALAQGLRATDDWQELLGLVEIRVRLANDPRTSIEILREAAVLHEQRANDPGAALESVAHAFTLDPTDTGLEHELVRLGQATADWRTVADAYHTAVAVAAHPVRAAHLHMAEGRVRERDLGDAEGAARAYEAAAEHSPDALEVQQALVRASALAGRWPSAASGALAICRARGILDREVVDSLGQAASSRDAWAELVPAFEAALGRSPLPAKIARDLELWAAHAHRDRLANPVAARGAARRALAHDDNHLPTLELLAELERTTDDAQLIDTLVAIDARHGEDVAALREAAELALGGAADPTRGRALVHALHRKAAHLLVQDGAKGARADERQAAVSWSLDRLIALALGAGEAMQAIEALLAAGDLPLPRSEVLDLRVRAAKIAIDVGDRARAIDLLRAVLEERDTDLEVLTMLASLCEREGRVLELVRLRTRELDLTREPERRLALRLEVSRLVGVLEQQGGRVDALRRNLAECPGHGPSVTALTEILEDKGRHGTLCDILEEQAALLEGSDRLRSAELWGMTAKIAEDRLADPARAITALARRVELVVDLDALDSLARLHTARNEPLAAASYLERRLEPTEHGQRVPVLLRLARAQLQAELETAAIGTLEAAFAEAPKNAEVRKLLLRLYRQGEQWEPLARTLAIAAEAVSDSATVLAHAREAAEIWGDRLAAPDRAVQVLERAVVLAPDDRDLKNRLAEGLRVGGRLDEARGLLADIVAGFGRRRSQERAAVHLQLAKVLHAQGTRTEALDQLELAAGMDASNPAIAYMLAQTARQNGDLDRAERAYRALLLIVRRPVEAAGEPTPVGPAEVLIELASIAHEHGQIDQAQELVESALEALAGNDLAAPRLQQLLRERGDHALLRRVLEVRLQHVDNRRDRAEVLGDLADLVGGTFGDDAGAFDFALQAVNTDPGSPSHHARALGLAEGLGRVDAYHEVIEHHLDKARRSSDAHMRCELLLRHGEVLERFENDFEGARDSYQQAETTGVREVDVWRAMARLAAARGEVDEHLQLLERLAELGEQASETRADALYRMAEVHLADADTQDRGLAALQEALTTDARPERAARILARATDPQLAAPRAELLSLFEQVARRSGDEAALLLALERRAALPEAVPEDVREAVELATKRGDEARAEALLLRATELASGLLDGGPRTAWALVGLSERRRAAGDVEGAVKWFALAAPVCRPDELAPLGQALADAAEPSDPALAVRVYEAVLERDPAERRAWEPLARLYRRLGDADRLHRLVEEMLDSLPGPAERNALRLELVQSLLGVGDRIDAAITVLREVLREQPEHTGAQAMLVNVLEEAGQTAEIAELLHERLLAARANDDVVAIVDATLAFVRRIAAEDRDRALEALRAALGSASTNRDLLIATIEMLGDDGFEERARLSERLIEAEDPTTAARLARELADGYLARGEAEGAQRALVAGYRRAPDDAEIRQRLERTYEERGDYRGLAEMLRAAATGDGEPSAKVALLRQAATIERDLLGDPESSQAILEQAYALVPGDAEIGLELCSSFASTGRIDKANAILDELLATTQDDNARLHLLTTRAEMRMQTDDWSGAVSDLEAALAIDPDAVRPTLISALERARQTAQAAFDVDGERSAMLRLCELMQVQERRAEARALLTEWVDRERKDVAALELLQEIDIADERWEAVAKASARLVAIESGDAQVRAALRLSHACQQMDRPGDARAGLEHARRKQPNVREIRDQLRRIYELIGAERELAKLIVAEAEESTDPVERIELTRRAADLLLGQGDVEAALPLVRAVVEANPHDIHATILLADAHLAAGEVTEAEAVIDAVLAEGRSRKAPELALLHHRKARAAGARGAPEEQLTELQHAFGQDKNNGWIAAELADMAEALEEWDLAVKVLRTITLIDGDCPITRTVAFLRQAKIAHRRGDRQRAILWARKAKHEDATNTDVLEFLTELGDA